MTALQTTVTVLVVLGRLLVPLGIPRFPVPALLGALVLDAVDQTVFQATGSVPQDYQSYDKALDVYYLAVAYAATLRNWSHRPAFRIGRFLWYYRLVGVVAFELSGHRLLLLLFPNAFEYFFLAYELIRTRWRPTRMSPRAVAALAAGIWVGIKLPQEYWIHVAQLDVTEQVAAHPWAAAAVGACLLAALLAITSQRARLPVADWPFTLDVDRHRSAADTAAPTRVGVLAMPYLASVLEKIALLSLVTVIFSQVLPVRATTVQISLAVALLVAVNGSISLRFARRGRSWTTLGSQFLAMAAVNGGLVLTLRLARGSVEAQTPFGVTLFVLLLLSLLITLYDRYRVMQDGRFARLGTRQTDPPDPAGRGSDIHAPLA